MSKYKARNKEFAGSVSPLDYKHMPNSSEVLMTRPQAQKLIAVPEKAAADADREHVI